MPEINIEVAMWWGKNFNPILKDKADVFSVFLVKVYRRYKKGGHVRSAQRSCLG